MKIVFIGSVEIGFKALKQIIKDGWVVSAVFTLAKKYAGRTSGFVDFSSIAKKNNIVLHKVGNINTDRNIIKIRKMAPDLIVVCGWQRLVCEDILKIPKSGTVGFHSSLLPKYRGRAPVNWAIIMGEKKTGVTMFYCEREADAGDIIAQKSFPITLSDTCGTVYDKSAKAVCQMLHKYLPLIENGSVKSRKNVSSRYRFWPKRNPRDGHINWHRNAIDIHNWIRALTHPYPGAFTYYNGKKYFIWKSDLSTVKTDHMHKPGEIVTVTKNNCAQVLLVATRDTSIKILHIMDKRGVSDGDFAAGNRFL